MGFTTWRSLRVLLTCPEDYAEVLVEAEPAQAAAALVELVSQSKDWTVGHGDIGRTIAFMMLTTVEYAERLTGEPTSWRFRRVILDGRWEYIKATEPTGTAPIIVQGVPVEDVQAAEESYRTWRPDDADTRISPAAYLERIQSRRRAR